MRRDVRTQAIEPAKIEREHLGPLGLQPPDDGTPDAAAAPVTATRPTPLAFF